jgi:L-ascorbate metabolism protein UlaG (beta-lactamase superfamily)
MRESRMTTLSLISILSFSVLFSPQTAGNEISIQYHGRSCFQLTFGETKIVIDPFDPEFFEYSSPEVPYRLPNGQIDYAFSSHSARDHDYFQGINADRTYLARGDRNELILTREGKSARVSGKTTEKLDGRSFTFWTVPSFHDDQRGAVDGVNGILCLDFDGLKVVHLGDLGHVLERAQIDAIGNVDVLMIPVDGRYTLGAETAKEIVEQLGPKHVIPMHYKTDNLKQDLPFSDEKSFVEQFPNVEIHDKRSLSINRAALASELKIVVLEYHKQ